MEKQLKYSYIDYVALGKLDLTINEYLFCDIVYKLQTRSGVCYASYGYLAKCLNLSTRTIATLYSKLVKKGLIDEVSGVKGEIKNYKVTNLWEDTVIFVNEETSYPHEKSSSPHEDTSSPHEDISYNNKINNTSYNKSNNNTAKAEFEVSFNKFWEVFPSRRKTDKTKCRKKWGSLSLEVRNVILGDVPKRVLGEDWTKSNGQYTPAPLSYLNGEKWESSIITPKVFALPQNEVIDQAAEFDRTFGKE